MIYGVLIFQLPKYIEVGFVLTIQIHFALLVSADSNLLSSFQPCLMFTPFLMYAICGFNSSEDFIGECTLIQQPVLLTAKIF